MSETAFDPEGALRLQRELFERRAHKEGHVSVVLRAMEDGEDCVVACEVQPVDAPPIRPQPYRFPTVAEASRFVEEATLALQYLGCVLDRRDAGELLERR